MTTTKKALDSTITKWFVRGITGILLGAYCVYIIQTKIKKREQLDLHADDWWIMGISLAVWVAYESVVQYLKNKASKTP